MPTGLKEKIDATDPRFAFIDWRPPEADENPADGKTVVSRSKDDDEVIIPPGYAPL